MRIAGGLAEPVEQREVGGARDARGDRRTGGAEDVGRHADGAQLVGGGNAPAFAVVKHGAQVSERHGAGYRGTAGGRDGAWHQITCHAESRRGTDLYPNYR
ncbi:hypothetical protein D3C87_1802520 [compost metagenome]